jgi:hypothetical protein
VTNHLTVKKKKAPPTTAGSEPAPKKRKTNVPTE